MRSLASQGAKAIVSYNDFGAAALPAFKAAQQQGAFISTYVGPVPDAPADSLASQVHGDTVPSARRWRRWPRTTSGYR